MELEEIRGKVPKEIIESLEARGIRTFTPPQAYAIEKGLIEGKSVVVASPTASGKTLVAELACAITILSKFKRAVYVAPMRALASEKFNEFRETYPFIRSVISTGDLDADDRGLAAYQMLFFSTEKFDSLIRHGIDWLGSVGCFVFDEVHMIGDPSRGPTMELLMTKLKAMTGAQMIALSATIGNAREIADWLGTELVESDYRPVKLSRSIVCNGVLHGYDGGREKIEALLGESELPEVRVVEDTLQRGKQAIIFYATRRSAEFGAARIAKQVYSTLSHEQKEEASRISGDVLGVLSQPTEQCVKLGSLVEKGVAFHHAGLMSQQRSIIEESFKANRLKVLCSTTTLGYGVNLPAHTVLVRDTTRFDGNYRERIGVNEILQLFGRAGRPKYDTEGRAIITATGKHQIPELKRRYITANPDPITSSLGVASVLRSHVLAFIAERFLNSRDSISKFISGSLYGMQYGDRWEISAIITKVLDDLEKWGFVEQGNRAYSATKLGARVSELYIDPLSARMMIDSFKSIRDTFDILLMLSNTLEMKPHARATKPAEERYATYLSRREMPSSIDITMQEYADYDPVRVFSTAMMLEDWIGEKKEAEIVKAYASSPGALYAKITNADWLIYSATELAAIAKVPRAQLVQARVRLRYGIKEELLDLVRLEQVGRVRARTLYINGITTVQELRKSRDKAESLLGKEVAKRIFTQLE